MLIALLPAASRVDTAAVHHTLLGGLGQDTLRAADGKARRGHISSTFVALTAVMIVEWVQWSRANGQVQATQQALDSLERSSRDDGRPPLVTVARF